MSGPSHSKPDECFDQALGLLRLLSGRRSSRFSGIGIVFYHDLATLPHMQLTNNVASPDLSRFAGTDLADGLISISSMDNPLHDGFHFIDATSWRLTHLSQFISPPIPQDAERNFHGTGARLIAAVLASLLPGIAYVGLVAQDGKIRLYCNGIDIIKDELTDG